MGRDGWQRWLGPISIGRGHADNYCGPFIDIGSGCIMVGRFYVGWER